MKTISFGTLCKKFSGTDLIATGTNPEWGFINYHGMKTQGDDVGGGLQNYSAESPHQNIASMYVIDCWPRGEGPIPG